MRTFVISAALLLATTPAFAWESPSATAHSSASSRATARSSANAAALATGGTGNGSVSVNTERSTAAPALGGLSSGSCSGVSGGVSLGFLPFGGGANLGTIDPQCTLRNNILIVGQFQPGVAMEMLKGLDGYTEAVTRLNPPPPGETAAWCKDPAKYKEFRGDIFCPN